MQRSWAYLLVMCSVCVASPSHGHHSPAMFDRGVEVVIEGRIATLEWRNPHVYMTIETAAPGKKTIERRIEAGPPSILLSLGVTAESLRVGDVVTVRANPLRKGGDGMMLGLDAKKADGTVVPLHTQTAAASAKPGTPRATSIVGTWVGQPAGFDSLRQAMASWPLTRKARQAITENREAMLKSMAECVPVGPPTLMVFPVVIVIERHDDALVFNLDWMDARRTVYVDGRDHPRDLKPTLLGHSVGRWDGDVLVVDTVGFAAHPEGMGFELPSSAMKHIIERFALSEDRKHLDYQITVEDSEYLSQPVTHRAQWVYRPAQRPSGIRCDPEVARRFLSDQ